MVRKVASGYAGPSLRHCRVRGDMAGCAGMILRRATTRKAVGIAPHM